MTMRPAPRMSKKSSWFREAAINTGIGAALVVLAGAGLATIFLVIRMPAHHLSVKNCEIFQEESGYETKFVDYNFFKWDCLAKTSTGKWVDRDKLRDID